MDQTLVTVSIFELPESIAVRISNYKTRHVVLNCRQQSSQTALKIITRNICNWSLRLYFTKEWPINYM